MTNTTIEYAPAVPPVQPGATAAMIPFGTWFTGHNSNADSDSLYFKAPWAADQTGIIKWEARGEEGRILPCHNCFANHTDGRVYNYRIVDIHFVVSPR
jgi:hypothetical protein